MRCILAEKLEVMTETEKKLYDYAVSVDWDFDKVVYYLDYDLDFELFEKIKGLNAEDKASKFIEKYKPKQPESITLPIEDCNRLRKLEIKQEIKRLKRELKRL